MTASADSAPAALVNAAGRRAARAAPPEAAIPPRLGGDHELCPSQTRVVELEPGARSQPVDRDAAHLRLVNVGAGALAAGAGPRQLHERGLRGARAPRGRRAWSSSSSRGAARRACRRRRGSRASARLAQERDEVAVDVDPRAASTVPSSAAAAASSPRRRRGLEHAVEARRGHRPASHVGAGTSPRASASTGRRRRRGAPARATCSDSRAGGPSPLRRRRRRARARPAEQRPEHAERPPAGRAAAGRRGRGADVGHAVGRRAPSQRRVARLAASAGPRRRGASIAARDRDGVAGGQECADEGEGLGAVALIAVPWRRRATRRPSAGEELAGPLSSRTSRTSSGAGRAAVVSGSASAASSPSQGRMSRAKSTPVAGRLTAAASPRSTRRRAIGARGSAAGGRASLRRAAAADRSRRGRRPARRRGTSAARLGGGPSAAAGRSRPARQDDEHEARGPSAAHRRRRRHAGPPGRAPGGAPRRGSASRAALDEVDDQRDALEAVALAQAVLDEVGVVARQPVRELTWIAKRGGRAPVWVM